MNIHIVYLLVLQSLASQIRVCAPRKAKWLTNDIQINRSRVLNPGQKVTPSIRVVAWGESQSLRYAQGDLESVGPYLTMGLSINLNISKNNTEIKYKLNYSRTMMGFFCCCCFRRMKARIMLAVLNWNKSLNNDRFAKLCLKLC